MTKKINLTKVYTDAGWRTWNESPIYVAHIVKGKDGDIVNKRRIQAEAVSSVYIEYLGLIYAMEYCLRTGVHNVHFMNDNQTMVYQVLGKYRVKTSNLVALYDTVMELWDLFRDVGGVSRLSWIKRELNEADKFVKELKND